MFILYFLRTLSPGSSSGNSTPRKTGDQSNSPEYKESPDVIVSKPKRKFFFKSTPPTTLKSQPIGEGSSSSSTDLPSPPYTSTSLLTSR